MTMNEVSKTTIAELKKSVEEYEKENGYVNICQSEQNTTNYCYYCNSSCDNSCSGSCKWSCAGSTK